jgi:hypothetical protein
MIIKFLGLKISLEIIILLMVIYLVMMVHALAGCCNTKAIAEGFSDMVKPKIDINKLKDKIKNVKTGEVSHNTPVNVNEKLVENIIL